MCLVRVDRFLQPFTNLTTVEPLIQNPHKAEGGTQTNLDNKVS